MKIIFITTKYPSNYRYVYVTHACMCMHMHSLLLGENSLLNYSKVQVYNADQEILDRALKKIILNQLDRTQF